MPKTLAPRQVFALLFLLLISNAMTVSQGLGRDGWLSLAFALLWTLPVYALLLKTGAAGGGRNWPERMTGMLGAFPGGVLLLLLAALAALLSVFSLRGFLLLAQSLALSRTSPFLLGAAIMLCAAFFASRDVLQAGRWAAPVFWLVLVFLAASLLLTIPDWDPAHLYPLLTDGWRSPLRKSFPLALTIGTEGVFLLAMTDNQGKIYSAGARQAAWFSYLLLLCVFLRNLFLLGFPLSSRLLNASYTAAGLISLGSFFQRGEVLVTIPFVLCDLLKLSILLMFAKNSLLTLFPRLPAGKLTLGLSAPVWAAGCTLAQKSPALLAGQERARLSAVFLFVLFSLLFLGKRRIQSAKSTQNNQKYKEDSL